MFIAGKAGRDIGAEESRRVVVRGNSIISSGPRESTPPTELASSEKQGPETGRRSLARGLGRQVSGSGLPVQVLNSRGQAAPSSMRT